MESDDSGVEPIWSGSDSGVEPIWSGSANSDNQGDEVSDVLDQMMAVISGTRPDRMAIQGRRRLRRIIVACRREWEAAAHEDVAIAADQARGRLRAEQGEDRRAEQGEDRPERDDERPGLPECFLGNHSLQLQCTLCFKARAWPP